MQEPLDANDTIIRTKSFKELKDQADHLFLCRDIAGDKNLLPREITEEQFEKGSYIAMKLVEENSGKQIYWQIDAQNNFVYYMPSK